METPFGPEGHKRLATVAVGLWAVCWLVVGLVTGFHIRDLTEVSDSLVESGKALDSAGTALQDVGRLPVVGERPRELGDQVRRTAAEVREAGVSSRQTVRWVSVLVGAALVLIPVVPVGAVYTWAGMNQRRARRPVARELAAAQPNPLLEQFLANQAVQNLPYDVLRQVSADPWGDLRQGSYRRLANAELTRLGLAKRRGAGSGGGTAAGGPAG